jgi:uncharacterized protein YndB with AHSA1/START domain
MDVYRERTPEGRRIVVERRVDAPAEAVWDVFRDTDLWPEWGPSVQAVECEDRYVSEGTTGRVRVLGAWIPFEVTSCTDRRWTWDVAGIPATGHRVGEDPVTAAFEVPVAAAPYTLVCRRALEKISALAANAE